MYAASPALHLPSATRAFVSRHYDETVDYVARRLAPHRMDVAPGERIATEIRVLSLGTIDLVEISYGADVHIAPAALDDCYMVHAAVAGSSYVEDPGGPVALHTGNLHILSPGQAPVFHLSRTCRHVAVRIPAALLDRQLARRIDGEVRTPLVFAATSPADAPLAGTWRRLLAHIVDQARAAPAAMQGALAAHYGELLIALLLDQQPSNYEARLRDSTPTICPRHVRRARALIEQSGSEALSIGDLAAAVQVSPRSLQNGFRQFMGVTPAEYIRNHRLAQLHAALETAPPDSLVTDLMLARGISDFGRFAGYYRRRYGCAPSATLRRR